MASIFSKIISGEIPSHKVAESDQFIAFLDVRPLQLGHTLVVPKQEVDYIFDLEDETLQGLMVFAKKVAKAMDQVLEGQRTGLSVIGLEVPHAHVHLIPINSVTDMTFGPNRPEFSPEKMEETAAKISKAFTENNQELSVDGFNYEDYLALTLLYVSNTSEGISEKEMNYITNNIPPNSLAVAKEYFDKHSEFQIIQKIEELSHRFPKTKQQVIQDIKKVIHVDGIDLQTENYILHLLEKML